MPLHSFNYTLHHDMAGPVATGGRDEGRLTGIKQVKSQWAPWQCGQNGRLKVTQCGLSSQQQRQGF